MLAGANRYKHETLSLMLGVLQQIDQHEGRYDPSPFKREERERLVLFHFLFLLAEHITDAEMHCTETASGT